MTYANQVKCKYTAKIPQQHNFLVLLEASCGVDRRIQEAKDHDVYYLLQLSWRVISVLSRVLVLKYVKSILDVRVGLKETYSKLMRNLS